MVIGREARALGIDVSLQPYVNIDRDLAFKRAYDTFGEDPLLTSLIGAAEIRGIQSQHVMVSRAEYTASGRFHASITAMAMRLTRAGLSRHAARLQAVDRLYALVQTQAAVLSYVDIYWLLAMGSVIMFVASFLLKRNEPGKSAKVSVH